jgi:tetratricopeptide (TPR) repeat protein
MTYFQQALDLRQKVASPADIADTTYNIGETYTRTGRYSQGLDYFLKALDLWRKAGDQRGVAFASYGLGRVFQYEGRYGASLNAAQDALKKWQDTGERGFWLPEMQANYANALIMMGRPEEAGKNLEEALAAARELKNDSLIARILDFQGDRFFYSGDLRSAKGLYQQALQSASRSKDREQVLIAQFNLAKIAIKEGKARESVALMQSLAETADKAGLEHLSVQASLYAGQALIEGKDYKGARQQLETSLRKSDQLGLQLLLAKSHYLLATALRLGGSSTQAEHHYTQTRRILDGIRNEAHSDSILKRSDIAPMYEDAKHWLPDLKT